MGSFREQIGGTNYPDIIIYSADLSELLGILESKALDRLADWLLVRIEALQRVGAEFAAIASSSTLVEEDPEIFGRSVAGMHRELGLKILGGCCGTDDRHIRSLAAQLAIGR